MLREPPSVQEIVETNNKKRFTFNADKTKIRANQGHSINVDLQLAATVPPDVLYHGTHSKAVESIVREGLQKMARHHVHLSADLETARQVGRRRGKPVVFQVDAAAMHQQGYEFYRSQNGVWLVDRVPPEFIRSSLKNL